MRYQTTLLEDWIKDFLNNLGIYHPHQLDFLDISNRLGLVVHFKEFSSRVYQGEIIIDSRLPPIEQSLDFAHELCHILRQEGNQLITPAEVLKLQESKAENFSLHFCVPTFMLLNFSISNYKNIEDGIPFIAETFNVSEDFAKKRLIHFKNQIQQAKSDEEHRKFMERLYPKAKPYSDETNAILKKLYMQLEKKGVKSNA
jgi:Zn-dependent peptidase ImmA (M78 family)